MRSLPTTSGSGIRGAECTATAGTDPEGSQTDHLLDRPRHAATSVTRSFEKGVADYAMIMYVLAYSSGVVRVVEACITQEKAVQKPWCGPSIPSPIRRRPRSILHEKVSTMIPLLECDELRHFGPDFVPLAEVEQEFPESAIPSL